MRTRTALTLVESLIVIAIIAVIVAIALPVMFRARRSAEVSKSVSQMRQIHLAVEVYRQDYDGNDQGFTYRSLALPYVEYVQQTKLGLTDAVWQSPCGSDQTLFETGPSWVLGWIGFGPAYYDDRYVFPGSPYNPEYLHYLAEYKQNAVLVVDHYCNDAGTNLEETATKKRALAVLLSGQLVNTWRTGDAFFLHFYSDPPSD